MKEVYHNVILIGNAHLFLDNRCDCAMISLRGRFRLSNVRRLLMHLIFLRVLAIVSLCLVTNASVVSEASAIPILCSHVCAKSVCRDVTRCAPCKGKQCHPVCETRRYCDQEETDCKK